MTAPFIDIDALASLLADRAKGGGRVIAALAGPPQAHQMPHVTSQARCVVAGQQRAEQGASAFAQMQLGTIQHLQPPIPGQCIQRHQQRPQASDRP